MGDHFLAARSIRRIEGDHYGEKPSCKGQGTFGAALTSIEQEEQADRTGSRDEDVPPEGDVVAVRNGIPEASGGLVSKEKNDGEEEGEDANPQGLDLALSFELVEGFERPSGLWFEKLLNPCPDPHGLFLSRAIIV